MFVLPFHQPDRLAPRLFVLSSTNVDRPPLYISTFFNAKSSVESCLSFFPLYPSFLTAGIPHIFFQHVALAVYFFMWNNSSYLPPQLKTYLTFFNLKSSLSFLICSFVYSWFNLSFVVSSLSPVTYASPHFYSLHVCTQRVPSYTIEPILV